MLTQGMKLNILARTQVDIWSIGVIVYTLLNGALLGAGPARQCAWWQLCWRVRPIEVCASSRSAGLAGQSSALHPPSSDKLAQRRSALCAAAAAAAHRSSQHVPQPRARCACRTSTAAFTFVLNLIIPGLPHRALCMAWSCCSAPPGFQPGLQPSAASGSQSSPQPGSGAGTPPRIAESAPEADTPFLRCLQGCALTLHASCCRQRIPAPHQQARCGTLCAAWHPWRTRAQAGHLLPCWWKRTLRGRLQQVCGCICWLLLPGPAWCQSAPVQAAPLADSPGAGRRQGPVADARPDAARSCRFLQGSDADRAGRLKLIPTVEKGRRVPCPPRLPAPGVRVCGPCGEHMHAPVNMQVRLPTDVRWSRERGSPEGRPRCAADGCLRVQLGDQAWRGPHAGAAGQEAAHDLPQVHLPAAARRPCPPRCCERAWRASLACCMWPAADVEQPSGSPALTPAVVLQTCSPGDAAQGPKLLRGGRGGGVLSRFGQRDQAGQGRHHQHDHQHGRRAAGLPPVLLPDWLRRRAGLVPAPCHSVPRS